MTTLLKQSGVTTHRKAPSRKPACHRPLNIVRNAYGTFINPRTLRALLVPALPMYCRHCRCTTKAFRPSEVLREFNVGRTTLEPICGACGWVFERPVMSRSFREHIFELDNRECVYCSTTSDLSVDHVVPVILGGLSSVQNCVTACRRCNSSRGHREHGPKKQFGRFRNELSVTGSKNGSGMTSDGRLAVERRETPERRGNVA